MKRMLLLTTGALAATMIGVAPTVSAGSNGCTVSHIQGRSQTTVTEIACSGGPQFAATYLVKLPFHLLLARLNSSTPATFVIDETRANVPTVSVSYIGQSLLRDGRSVQNVRLVETKMPMTNKKATAAWKATVKRDRRFAKSLGLRVIKLRNGHPAIWYADGRPVQLFAHDVSVALSGSSAGSTAILTPRLTIADARAIASSLFVWHR